MNNDLIFNCIKCDKELKLGRNNMHSDGKDNWCCHPSCKVKKRKQIKTEKNYEQGEFEWED